MGQISARLRKVGRADGQIEGIAHWCHGCRDLHVIYTLHPSRAVWTWNGDVLNPTVTPSVRLMNSPGGSRCHYFLTEGVIHFLGDCEHDEKGRQVPLPDLPENWRD